MSGLSWDPVKRGKFYCSPGCGGGCTYAGYLAAGLQAERLAKELGEGWSGRVWENLGWHFKAVSPCGRVQVHRYAHNNGRCTAFLGPANQAGGTFTATASTPKKAVRAVIAKALEGIEEIQALLAGL